RSRWRLTARSKWPVSTGHGSIRQPVTAADTTFTWVSEGFLGTVGDEAQEWFPMWEPQFPGAHTYDAVKAAAAGLRCRPFAQTVANTLAWDQERGQPDLRTGLSKEKERELLATWHSRR